ncbi:kelch-like protein 5 isoform X1 [Arapaima gigas]
MSRDCPARVLIAGQKRTFVECAGCTESVRRRRTQIDLLFRFIVFFAGAKTMSASRKEFDMKQILRIRWRWLGHPASPPPHVPPPHTDFSGGRHAEGSHDDPSGSSAPGGGGPVTCTPNRIPDTSGSRKFPGALNRQLGFASGTSGVPRSVSEQERWNPPLAPWASCAHPEEPGVEVSEEGCAPQHQDHNPGDTAGEEVLGGEEENNQVDSDSSSCRY